MENKFSSLLNIAVINSNQPKKSNSLPNLATGKDSCCSPLCTSSSSKRHGSPWTRNPKIIPALLQKTWNKIKSMNKKRPTNSASPTPNTLMKFDFDSDVEQQQMSEFESPEMDPVQVSYAKLQKRLSEELHQGQIQIAAGKHHGKFGSSSSSVSEEFKKKLQQWEMWKLSCGKVTCTDEELKLILPEDFSKKLQKWEAIRASPSTNVKIEKQIQWLEKQLEKIEQEKGKLEVQMRQYLEKETRLEKMREALKNPRERETLIAAACVDENFTQNLYEWEELQGISEINEEDASSLLHPKYYNRVGGSSNSSEPPESEDIQENLLQEPNTPISSSSLESINQASGSNTSSADFYQKSRRRSSSLSLNRSPSLSAFTSDDEDNAGLLKTVEEEEVDDKIEPPPPVVRVNQIVVDDEEEPVQSHLIVATRRTLIQPIETESPQHRLIPLQSPSASSSTLKDLNSPSLVSKYISSSTSNTVKNEYHSEAVNITLPATSTSGKTVSNQVSTSYPSTSSKIHVEDIWNKNVDTSPPPIREGPKVVGFVPKLPPLPTMSSGSSSSTSLFSTASSTTTMTTTAAASLTSSVTNTTTAGIPSFSGIFIQQKSLLGSSSSTSGNGVGIGCDGLRNFPRMGKVPVWVSPLVTRRRMNSTSSCSNATTTCNDKNEFSLDRFLENRNLGSAVSASVSGIASRSTKYSFGNAFPSSQQDEGPVRLISLSRSSSFGPKLPLSQSPSVVSDTMTPPTLTSSTATTTTTTMNIPVPTKVLKSKSTSSVLKSGLNLFSKVRKSENLTNSNNNEPPVKPTKARWFLNKF